MSLWISSYPHLQVVLKVALNPAQVVSCTHGEAGSSRSIRSPSSPRTTAHRGTSTLQDWGEREEGRAVSAPLALAEASVIRR